MTTRLRAHPFNLAPALLLLLGCGGGEGTSVSEPAAAGSAGQASMTNGGASSDIADDTPDATAGAPDPGAGGTSGSDNTTAGGAGAPLGVEVSTECVETCGPVAELCAGVYTEEDCQVMCAQIEAQATEEEAAAARACLDAAQACLDLMPCIASF